MYAARTRNGFTPSSRAAQYLFLGYFHSLHALRIEDNMKRFTQQHAAITPPLCPKNSNQA